MATDTLSRLFDQATDDVLECLIEEIVKRTQAVCNKPRSVLDDAEAAAYCKDGLSTFRARRFHDQQLLEHITSELRKHSPGLYAQVVEGRKHPLDAVDEARIDHKPMRGPRWFRQGRAVRYALTDLDAWIESRRAAVMTEEKNPPRGIVATRQGRGG